MTEPLPPKVSFIIPVLHLQRPLNKKRFFMPRYTIREVLGDIPRNVTVRHEVVVVCNGQDPDLLELIARHPAVDKYCRNSVNVGVARSWNMGAEMAEGEILCFVNDDVEIGKGSIERLCEVLESAADVGQTGPAGALWKGAAHERFVGETVIEEADAISGFLFLIKAPVHRRVGGFDVAYTPAGFEEIDMSFAIRRAGFRCLVVPGVDVKHHHHHGVSAYNATIKYLTRQIDAETLHRRNKSYFERKWFHAATDQASLSPRPATGDV
jgi:GT2 family glycosyltransferase